MLIRLKWIKILEINEKTKTKKKLQKWKVFFFISVKNWKKINVIFKEKEHFE